MDWRTSFLGLAALAAVSCTKPELPKVTPISARVVRITSDGVDLTAKLQVYNPNDIDLSIRSVTAKVTLDDKYDIGTFKESKPVTLPAKKNIKVDVPIQARWHDIVAVAQLAASGRDIDYAIDGKALLGGEFLNVELPFRVTGKVTQAEMQQAATKALQKVKLPGGFPIPAFP